MKGRMKVKMTPLIVVMVAILNGEDKSSCVLEEIEVVVFRFCLQRPKDVIFEGLSRESLVMEF